MRIPGWVSSPADFLHISEGLILTVWSISKDLSVNIFYFLWMFAVPKMTIYTCRWWQLIKWFSFEDVDYDTRATSLALEIHFARAEDVFPKVGIRFLESNIIDERGRLCTLVIKWEMIPMGHIMRQSTSECRVSILCCRPSRYTYLPHQTQTTRDC